MYISKLFLLKNHSIDYMLFGGYIISSLSIIISYRSLSNTYIQEFSYGKHRVARNVKNGKYIIICSFMSVSFYYINL